MIVIVDYGVGNLTSVQNMFRKSGNAAIISNNVKEIEQCTKILLPGMGAFDNCMFKLQQSALLPVIEKKVLEEKIPLLGICVGLQMLMQSSEEGNCAGLGWVKGKTVKFDKAKLTAENKIPNMGWIDTILKKESKLFDGLVESRFYFAHSYHVAPADADLVIAGADYGYEFASSIEQDNILGVQFHPEKSHRFGMQLFKNFAEKF